MGSFLFRLSGPDYSDESHEPPASFNIDDLKDEMMLLLCSRPFYSHGQIDNQDLQCSVINYGVSDVYDNQKSHEERCLELCERVKVALFFFEPRINHPEVSIFSTSGTGCIFEIRSKYESVPFVFYVNWDSVYFHFTLCDENNM